MNRCQFLIVHATAPPLLNQRVDDLSRAVRLPVRARSPGHAVLSSGRLTGDGEGGGHQTKLEGRSDLAVESDDSGPVLLDGVEVARSSSRLIVTTAPAGATSCFWCRTRDLVLIASGPALLQASGLWQPAIDWDGLGSSLYAASLPSPRTGLAGCFELLPGFALSVDRDGTIETIPAWSPWVWATKDNSTTSSQLEDAIVMAVSAAAKPFDRILLATSGGLDSSIVAAALAAAGRDFACVTLATEDPDGDERAYARAVANWFGVDLVEAHYTLDDIDIFSPAVATAARPTARTHEQSFHRRAADALDRRAADVLFTGNGGDALFCITQSGVALTDRILARGPGPAAASTLMDLCRLTGAGPAPVARMAARKLRRHHRRYLWRGDRSFLTSDIADRLDAKALSHPWLDVPAGGLPGRAVHIAMLLRVQQALGLDRGFLSVDPLMTRSLIELALGIPTWRWVEGGVDRAVARRAFATRLPKAVLERRVKGGPDSFGVALVERFRAAMTERLVEGCLVANGIIAPRAIGLALRQFGPRQGLDHVRLLQLLEAENWVAHWETQERAGQETSARLA